MIHWLWLTLVSGLSGLLYLGWKKNTRPHQPPLPLPPSFPDDLLRTLQKGTLERQKNYYWGLLTLEKGQFSDLYHLTQLLINEGVFHPIFLEIDERGKHDKGLVFPDILKKFSEETSLPLLSPEKALGCILNYHIAHIIEEAVTPLEGFEGIYKDLYSIYEQMVYNKEIKENIYGWDGLISVYWSYDELLEMHARNPDNPSPLKLKNELSREALAEAKRWWLTYGQLDK